MSSPPTNINTQRSDSVSSVDSNTPGSPTNSKRRSSSGLYANLHAQKRSEDPISTARRQSMHDQRPKGGIFSNMWNNYVRGPSKSP